MACFLQQCFFFLFSFMPDLEFTSAVQALLSSKIFWGCCVDGSEHELHINIKQTSETFFFGS